MLNFWRKKSTSSQNLIICMIVFCCVTSAFCWLNSEDAKLHKKGRKYIQERKWEEASQVFYILLEQFPNSLYCDNALFWIGFSLEQEPGKEVEAYQTYQKIVDNYPESPWVNDALVHQIFISKKLSQKADESYRPFLEKQLASADQTIRFQAALALSELGDESILPVLEEMVMKAKPQMAQRAMEALHTFSSTIKAQLNQSEDESTDWEMTYQEKSLEIIYKKLSNLKKDDFQKLLDNGLYHIIPKKDLIFYLSLDNDWDRQAWWRRFWASKDPTPTTEVNEAEEEFKHRVAYAYKFFKKEWQADDPFYPPWDSRGEVYIKYGKPDIRKQPEDQWEEWTYNSLRLSFKISDHLPNNKGEGIHFSAVSHYIYRHNIHRQRYKIIFEPQFYYVPQYLENNKKINDFQFKVISIKKANDNFNIQFSYKFPGRNIDFKKQQDNYQGAFRYRWVILDEDYQTISSSDLVRELTFKSKKRIRKSIIEGTIETELSPGIYQIALRIEDLGSKALGIYRKNFKIQENN